MSFDLFPEAEKEAVTVSNNVNIVDVDEVELHDEDFDIIRRLKNTTRDKLVFTVSFINNAILC